MKTKLVIGIIVSLIFLYFAFSTVDFSELALELKKINYLYLLPATLLLYFTIFLRAVRWQYLLTPVKEKIPITSLFSAMTLGLFSNSVLPARMGEFVFAIVIGKKEDISKTAAFATIVVSRIFDGVTLLFILLATFLFLPSINPKLNTLGFTVTIIYSMAIIGILSLYFAQEKILILIRNVLFFLPEKIIQKINEMLESFIEGLHFLKDAKSILLIFIYSIIIWIFVGFSYLPIVYAFPFGKHLPFYASFFILGIVAFGVMLPSSPGFVGTFHAFAIFALTLIAPDISKDAAAGFAIVLHAAQVIPMVILGFIYLWKEGISLTSLEKQSEKLQAEQ